MPRKLSLSHKKSHSKTTFSIYVLCEMATQTDNRTKTMDATTQTNDIQNSLGQSATVVLPHRLMPCILCHQCQGHV